jgi:hypothetical protein
VNSLQTNHGHPIPWNKGKLIGQRPALKLQEVWAIRIRLELSKNIQELALFNLAIDSKLRSCDLIQYLLEQRYYSKKHKSQCSLKSQQEPVTLCVSLFDQTTLPRLIFYSKAGCWNQSIYQLDSMRE